MGDKAKGFVGRGAEVYSPAVMRESLWSRSRDERRLAEASPCEDALV
jgi:hypothetical protein